MLENSVTAKSLNVGAVDRLTYRQHIAPTTLLNIHILSVYLKSEKKNKNFISKLRRGTDMTSTRPIKSTGTK